MRESLFTIHKWDARNIEQLIKEEIVAYLFKKVDNHTSKEFKCHTTLK